MATPLSDLTTADTELRETHISRVLLSKTRALKLKKPVDLGFLDFRSLDDRRRFCEREVELNRRLAPRVYLGVRPVVRDGSGRHRLGEALAPGQPAPDGTVDFAVEMVRLPDQNAASARLARGDLGRAEVERLAAHLARFHQQARCDDQTSALGRPEHIERNVRENFEQTRSSAARYLSPSDIERIQRFQLGFLARHRERFAQRIAQRRVRDGHGDLRLEHCYFDAAEPGSIEIIDCIEFNERFRYGDVCADLAFLAMDLAWHERADLAEALLAAYAQCSGDFDLYGVVDFYESYRAYVRGKIASIIADDEGASQPAREAAAHDARKYYLLAEACSAEPLAPPVVVGLGGVIASGKSTLARALSERLEAPVVDSDRTRKQLAGVGEQTSLAQGAFEGHYSEDTTERVYRELLRRAALVLDSGRSVIVDASFRRDRDRHALRALAQHRGAPFVFALCTAPKDTLHARLRQREREGSVSDARAELLEDFLARFEHESSLPNQQLVRLQTTGEAGEHARHIMQRVGELRAS